MPLKYCSLRKVCGFKIALDEYSHLEVRLLPLCSVGLCSSPKSHHARSSGSIRFMGGPRHHPCRFSKGGLCCHRRECAQAASKGKHSEPRRLNAHATARKAVMRRCQFCTQHIEGGIRLWACIRLLADLRGPPQHKAQALCARRKLCICDHM